MKNITIRCLPCYKYDIIYLEKYFSQMAQKGLLFRRLVLGFACFEKIAPKNYKFRFIPAMNGTGLFSPNAGEPDEELKQMSNDLGWEYLTNVDTFYVFYTGDEFAQELCTDYDVQAMAVDEIRKKQGKSTVSSAIFWCLYISLASKLAGSFVMPMVLLGTPLFISLIILILGEIVSSIKRQKYLKRLSSILKGNILDAPKLVPYRLGGISEVVSIIFITVIAVLLIFMCFDDNSYKLSEYQNDIPFATISDIVSGEYEEGFLGTEIEITNDILAPVIIDFSENADITTPDGNNWSGSMYVTYIEFRNEALAKIAVKEIIRIDKMRKFEFEYKELPETDIDYSVAYEWNSYHLAPTILLRCGSKVVRMNFYQFSEYKIPTEIWLEMFCDKLQTSM